VELVPDFVAAVAPPDQNGGVGARQAAPPLGAGAQATNKDSASGKRASSPQQGDLRLTRDPSYAVYLIDALFSRVLRPNR